MRVLMTGAAGALALQRPLDWVIRSGHDVWLVSDHDPYPEHPPANYRFLPFWPLRSSNDMTPLSDQQRAIRVAQLRLLAQRLRPDVVHAHNMRDESYCCAAAGVRPLIISTWSALNWLLLDPDQPLPRGLRIMMDASQAVIVESPALVEACRRLPAPRPEIALIPLGADLRYFHAGYQAQRTDWRRALKIAADAAVLLSPRGWGANYNHDVILEAFGMAHSRLQRPVVLVFLSLGRNRYPGEAILCRDSVLRRAETLGLSPFLRWLPCLIHKMMPGIYAMADAVVNYPTHDAFPSTLVEAAACERPIITARLPSYAGTFVAEFCTSVEPGQPEALAEAMIQIVNQPAAERTERLRQARQAVVEHYDERLAQERLLQLYDKVAVR